MTAVHPSPSLVISMIALFVALSGTAVALDGSNTVFSDDIVDGEVKTPDLDGDAVTRRKLAADAVNSAKIVDGAVTTPKIGFEAVVRRKLAADAVNSAKVLNGSLTGVDIADNSLKGADIDESTLDIAARAGAWELDGNSGTTAADFLGTTDDRPLNLRVDGTRALRLEPAFDPTAGGNESPNVIGGAGNTVTPGVHSATIGGGGLGTPGDPDSANRVTDIYGTVGGGADNQAGDGDATTNDVAWATVGGGNINRASGTEATVGGGGANQAGPSFAATVGGGDGNVASGRAATVGGGEANFAGGERATVGGGFDNAATSFYGTVPGGRSNTAGGTHSFAAGRRAHADHNGSFVWADAFDLDFASTAANQFSARTTGGARFVSAIDGAGIPTAGVTLAPGGGSWASLSDEVSKQGIEPVSGPGVLAKLASIPISEWSYRAQGPEVRHIGPMAQDFHRAFGVGEDPRRITSIDADGVALAAIKGLNEKLRRKLNRKQALIASHERRLDRLERLLERRP